MERLVVDQSGGITIPPEWIQERGLRPGDELKVIKTNLGWTVYSDEIDDTTLAWLHSLTAEERRQAREEARWYESLSEEEKDAMWNEGAESLEEDAEGDEIDIPPDFRVAGERTP